MEIQIVKVNQVTVPLGSPPKYELILDGKGRGNGHRIAYSPNEKVLWTISNNVIKSIEGITWKQISGSTDIFPSTGPDSPQPVPRTNNTEWKAKIKGINDDVVYLYTISFKLNGPDTNTYEFDPIISIKPRVGFLGTLFFVASALVTSALAFLTLEFLFKKFRK